MVEFGKKLFDFSFNRHTQQKIKVSSIFILRDFWQFADILWGKV